MGKTYRRPAIKQHRDLEEAKYRSRVEKNKKNENKNKHPKRIIDEIYDIYGSELAGHEQNTQ